MDDLLYRPSDELELQYLYIYQRGPMVDSNINFGHRIKARMELTAEEKKFKLVIENNPHFIPSFFGNNIVNATAIVGANGAGKTMLTKYIQDFLDNYYEDDANWLAIFYHPQRNGLIIYDWIWDPDLRLKKREKSWHKFQHTPLENRSGYRIEYASCNQSVYRRTLNYHGNLDPYLRFDPYLSSGGVYYNPFFEIPEEFSNTELVTDDQNTLDVSNGNMAALERDQPGEYHYELHRYRAANQKRQLNLVNEFSPAKLKLINTGFMLAGLNPQVRAKWYDSEARFDISRFLEEKFHYHQLRPLSDMVSRHGPPRTEIGQKAVKKIILREFVISIIEALLNKEERLDRNKIINKLKKCKSSSPIAILAYFLKHCFKGKKKHFIPFIRVVIESIRDATPGVSNSVWAVNNETGVKLWDLHNDFMKLDYIKENILEFESTPYSSGENGMLNLFSRLQYGIKECHAREGSLIYLLIDEGETGFHPVWQKEYFHDLVQFLETFTQYKFYLIICTHSPMVVSDFPSENLILLRRDENGKVGSVNDLEGIKQTFGANIHTLLANSFFMQGSPVGKFAQEKIDAAFKWMQSDNQEGAGEMNTFINLIDEPLIKIKLREMFARKMGTAYEKQRIQEEIRHLQDKLKTL